MNCSLNLAIQAKTNNKKLLNFDKDVNYLFNYFFQKNIDDNPNLKIFVN